MKIHYSVEKLEVEDGIENDIENYFIINFKIETDDLECSFDFSLINEQVEEFINFTNNVHNTFVNNTGIFHYLNIKNGEYDTFRCRYINDNIILTYNMTKFKFKNIPEILSIFIDINTCLEKYLS